MKIELVALGQGAPTGWESFQRRKANGVWAFVRVRPEDTALELAFQLYRQGVQHNLYANWMKVVEEFFGATPMNMPLSTYLAEEHQLVFGVPQDKTYLLVEIHL